jgi:hypothetical protein
MINGSRRPGGLCENAEIEYGDAPNRHFPNRREIKRLLWCDNVAEYKVTGRNIKRSSFYCGACTEKIDPDVMLIEKIDKEG